MILTPSALQGCFRSLFAIHDRYDTVCPGTGCPEFPDAIQRRTPGCRYIFDQQDVFVPHIADDDIFLAMALL